MSRKPSARGQEKKRSNGRVFPMNNFPMLILPSAKRVRALLGGTILADSRDALVAHERGFTPVYYFPRDDVDTARLSPTNKTLISDTRGVARLFTVAAASGRPAQVEAAWSIETPTRAAAQLEGRFAFYFDRVDQWLEDGDEIKGSVPDPFVRIDIRRASEPVEVWLNGIVVARSTRALVVYETGLMPRYYFPLEDIEPAVVEPSRTTTTCVYKGDSRYADVVANGRRVEDGAWSYSNSTDECVRLKDHWCFWMEKMDATIIGDVEIAKPSAEDPPVLSRYDKWAALAGTS